MRDSCRYDPSCSEYAILAIQKYGVIKGWSMAIKRIYRCKPPFGGRDLP
ncbi:TPA: membrane protein insertion efficiency factor YidD [Morganella morganii]